MNQNQTATLIKTTDRLIDNSKDRRQKYVHETKNIIRDNICFQKMIGMSIASIVFIIWLCFLRYIHNIQNLDALWTMIFFLICLIANGFIVYLKKDGQGFRKFE